MTGFLNKIERLQSRALMTGICFLLLSAGGFFLDRRSFASAYLVSFLFWFNLSLGALPILCLHHLTGGNWGYPLRRLLEASFGLIPLVLLMSLPLFSNLEILYPWTRQSSASLEHHSTYLTIPLFIIRAVLYFAIWIFLANKPIRTTWLKKISGGALILYGLTGTFSAIDWGMSLEPHWYSTIYGLLYMAGQSLSAFAFAILMLSLFSKETPFSSILTSKRSHDLGNLLFAFVLVWAYMNISQFIIIWSGNLSEEVPWYLRRSEGGWIAVVFILTLFHFIVPFFLLLMRRVTNNIRFLGIVTAVILTASFINLFWLIKPALNPQFGLHWLDICLFAGLGGFWLWGWCRTLRQMEIILPEDPILP